MKLTIHLAASAAGLALIAAALPGPALAKGATTAPPATPLTIKAPVVSAHDPGTNKPKVEGWQTGGGEISDQSCQNFADRIGEQLDAAGEDADAGDYEGMENHLQGAEAWESMATDYGCAIKYPV